MVGLSLTIELCTAMAALAAAVADDHWLAQAVDCCKLLLSLESNLRAAVIGACLSLVVLQVQYSLLYRKPERNGVFEACKEAGATLVAYSPLCQGLLTGTGAAPCLPATPACPGHQLHDAPCVCKRHICVCSAPCLCLWLLCHRNLYQKKGGFLKTRTRNLDHMLEVTNFQIRYSYQ